MSIVPDSIAHLDFDPDAAPDEEITKLRECVCFPQGEPEKPCPHPAAWRGIYRCCMKGFYACNRHKKSRLWYCANCKKQRTDEWIGWSQL